MIYLRHVYEQVGLPAPSAVALYTDGLESWAVEDVCAEFAALFPGSELIRSPVDEGPWPLSVLVSETTARPDKVAATWGRQRRRHGDLALGFYTLQPREFEVLASRDLDRWLLRKQLLAKTRQARDRWPRAWEVAAAVYVAMTLVGDRTYSRRKRQ